MRIKIIIAGSFIFAGLIYFAHTKFIVVTNLQNGEFLVSNYRIKEENFFHPRLQFLRTRENLDRVVSSGGTQFEKAVLLRKWTRAQWKPGDMFYYPPWDAVEILDLARKYNNRGFCAQYAIVFLQACLSMGIHARYVDLPGHFLTAIWSDEYDKWIVMDPFYDLHFEKDGIPLSGRRLCEAYWKNDIKGICKVNSAGRKTQITRNDIYLFRKYSILLRTNHLSQPVDISLNGVWKKLTHSPDYRSYPLIGKDRLGIGDAFMAYKPGDATEFFTDRPYSEHPDDFRIDQNHTIIHFTTNDKEKNLVKIALIPDDSPTFKTFLVKVNDNGWQDVPDKLEWELKPGFNSLSARILTKFGWRCKESRIKLFYKPSWL